MSPKTLAQEARLIAKLASAAAREDFLQRQRAQLEAALEEVEQGEKQAHAAAMKALDEASHAGVPGSALCEAIGCSRLATMHMQLHRYRAARQAERRAAALRVSSVSTTHET